MGSDTWSVGRPHNDSSSSSSSCSSNNNNNNESVSLWAVNAVTWS